MASPGPKKIGRRQSALLFGSLQESHVGIMKSTESVSLEKTHARSAKGIARYGPFVMNTQTEIVQALTDYQEGRMGAILLLP